MKISINLILLLLVGIFLSYRLTAVPPGLTIDEAAFGYNEFFLQKPAVMKREDFCLSLPYQ